LRANWLEQLKLDSGFTTWEALGDAGVAVETLEPLAAFPDSVFLEDPALVLPEGAILLRPGASSRFGEASQ
jgi:dimethylargininase